MCVRNAAQSIGCVWGWPSGGGRTVCIAVLLRRSQPRDPPVCTQPASQPAQPAQQSLPSQHAGTTRPRLSLAHDSEPTDVTWDPFVAVAHPPSPLLTTPHPPCPSSAPHLPSAPASACAPSTPVRAPPAPLPVPRPPRCARQSKCWLLYPESNRSADISTLPLRPANTPHTADHTTTTTLCPAGQHA